MTSFTRQNPPTGFYTYAYLREDGRPYYIGKGGGTNPQRAWQQHGSKRKYWQPPCDDRILFLKWGMSEEQALAHEIYMIAVFGNHYVEGGWLTMNFTDGGEGISGYQYTEELRDVRREALAGNTYGANVAWTEELRQKLSDATIGVSKTRTVALLTRHEQMRIRYHWRHPEHGERFATAKEMSRETGLNEKNFFRVYQGQSRQTHGWVCLDPKNVFQPKVKDIQATAGKTAETKNRRGAAELGITLEEYLAMSYNQRSRAKRKLRLAA